MFFARHAARQPASASRGRAVPELTLRTLQPPAITTGHVLRAVAPSGEIVADGGLAIGSAEPPLRFTVVYQLGEYLALLREHLRATLLATRSTGAGRPSEALPWSHRMTLRWLLPLVVTPVFLSKKRRMPECHFAIDAQGIQRRTRDGLLQVAWTDVVAVHRYRHAWLVDKGRGGLPIPRRCMDDGQCAAFERLLERHAKRRAPA